MQEIIKWDDIYCKALGTHLKDHINQSLAIVPILKTTDAIYVQLNHS